MSLRRGLQTLRNRNKQFSLVPFRKRRLPKAVTALGIGLATVIGGLTIGFIEQLLDLGQGAGLVALVSWLAVVFSFVVQSARDDVIAVVTTNPEHELEQTPSDFLYEVGHGAVDEVKIMVAGLTNFNNPTDDVFFSRVACINAMRQAVRDCHLHGQTEDPVHGTIRAVCGDKSWDDPGVRSYFDEQLESAHDRKIEVRRVFIQRGKYFDKEKPILARHIVEEDELLKWRLVEEHKASDLIYEYSIPKRFGFALIERTAYIHWGLDEPEGSPVGLRVTSAVFVGRLEKVFDDLWSRGTDDAQAVVDLFFGGDWDALRRAAGEP